MDVNDIKAQIDLKNLPLHVAIIMDGNGRWAKERGKLRIFGHENGVKSVRETVEAAAELGVKYLTLYAYTITPVFIWGLFGVYRILFTEKIQITTMTLPFFNWSLENIIFWTTLVLCLVWKWNIGAQIQAAVYKSPPKTAALPTLIEQATIGGLLLVVWVAGTYMVPLFT